MLCMPGRDRGATPAAESRSLGARQWFPWRTMVPSVPRRRYGARIRNTATGAVARAWDHSMSGRELNKVANATAPMVLTVAVSAKAAA